MIKEVVIDMVLKIDTYGLASACDDAMEKRFPRNEYNDASNMGHKMNGTSLEFHKRENQMCVLSKSNNMSILVKRNALRLTYKPKGLFGGKAVQPTAAEVKIFLNDVISASESSLSHTGVNMVLLYVLDEDTSKLDNLLCVDGNKLVDLAGYIRNNNIAVYDFDLMS